jgi:hypothetical protein
LSPTHPVAAARASGNSPANTMAITAPLNQNRRNVDLLQPRPKSDASQLRLMQDGAVAPFRVARTPALNDRAVHAF